MNKTSFDYIICGGGASGLLLAKEMICDPYFKEKTFLLIEKNQKQSNDRTWCFWESGQSEFESVTHHQWDNARFKSNDVTLNFSLDPFQYKMLRSGDFYEQIHEKLNKSEQISSLQGTVLKIDTTANPSCVHTDQGVFNSDVIFSSILDPTELLRQKRYPVLQQHFIGWFVKTEQPCFEPDRITFMDFDIPQKGETRFLYVLPFNSNEALVEYTLFSKTLLEDKEYEAGIASYLKEINAGSYTILEKEKGSIPMSCYRFAKKNTNQLFHIGTAGGWTKASTGFTFYKTLQKTKKLVAYLKTNKPLSSFEKRNRFWYYDLLFLDVLYHYNGLGSKLFSSMFQNIKPKLVFRFLDEKSTLWEEFKIMSSFPVYLFVKALFKRVFRVFYA